MSFFSLRDLSLRPTPQGLSVNCRFGALILVAWLTSACGSNGGGSTSVLAPTIITQPANQKTTIGLAATFTVQAAGTAPLRYQWSKDGSAIPGASGPSYKTPAAAPSDNSATFTVIVANAAGAVTSNAASLAVGPRAPRTGDWRFQALGLPAFDPFLSTLLLSREQATYPNAIGTPLTIGVAAGLCTPPEVADNCDWGYVVYSQPAGGSGINAYYWSDYFTNLDVDLQTVTAPNSVITSLDLEPTNGLFAVSWLQTSAMGDFIPLAQLVDPQQMQAVVSQLGENSQVVTALAFNAGQVQLVSYGWQSDTTTIYEAKTVVATNDNFITEAADLSASGYIITALGGDPTNGLILVGTRVQGDTMPRPILLITPTGTQGQLDKTVEAIRRDIWSSVGESWIEQQ
jgi:hypothetical protein